MESKTRIDLSSLPLDRASFAIKNLIDELAYVKDTLNTSTCESIIEEIVARGYTYANNINATAPQSGLEKSWVDREVSTNYGEISLNGKNAVYDEFGTGEEGADDGHPLKGFYGLNPYNSGPVVSKLINPLTGRHFWIYEPMAGREYFGERGYTEGIPSGKQMYHTLNYIDSIKDEIIIEKINDTIRVLK